MICKIFEFTALQPSALSWKEMYDIGFLALLATGEEIIPLLETLLKKLEKRVAEGIYFGRPVSPRVLVTGCPVGGNATKIFKVIEDAGGVAKNPCMRRLLEEALERQVLVHDDPQMVGALGAALLARESI